MLSDVKRVLVVAAHPDDEVLGCGGTVARLSAQGCEVVTVIAAEGSTARQPTRDAQDAFAELSHLRAVSVEAGKILGCLDVRHLGFPDNRMDGFELLEVVKAVEAVIDEVNPEVVVCHWGGDLNVDHQTVQQAVVTACRPLPGASVRAVLEWETASATEWTSRDGAFAPNFFVDIAETLGAKIDALRQYHSEMRDFPHARSYQALEALARLRGSQVGAHAAEAFVVRRAVW
jgi:LmbE family N-acetylglucosaminyl deacetylase